MEVTEIAIVSVQKGKSPEDVSSPAGQAWKDIFEIVASQPGFVRQYWGMAAEDEDSLWLFVDWENIESHHKFMETDEYNGPMAERLKTLLVKPPRLYHVQLKPQSALCLSAPVTEVLRTYFPSSYSESDQQTFSKNMKKFEQKAGGKGCSGGWLLEEVLIPGTSENYRVHVTVFGWQSLEAHQSFREMPGFKDNVHILRDAKDKKKSEVVHVSFKEVQKSGGKY